MQNIIAFFGDWLSIWSILIDLCSSVLQLTVHYHRPRNMQFIYFPWSHLIKKVRCNYTILRSHIRCLAVAPLSGPHELAENWGSMEAMKRKLCCMAKSNSNPPLCRAIWSVKFYMAFFGIVLKRNWVADPLIVSAVFVNKNACLNISCTRVA